MRVDPNREMPNWFAVLLLLGAGLYLVRQLVVDPVDGAITIALLVLLAVLIGVIIQVYGGVRHV